MVRNSKRKIWIAKCFWKNESSSGSKSCLYSRLWFDLRLLVINTHNVFVLFLKMPWFHQSKYLISNQNIRLPIKILSRTVPSWATPLHAHQWGTLSAPSFRLSNDLKFKRKYLQNRNIVKFVPRWLWVWIILIIEWEYRERLKESFFENIESFLRDYRELLLYRVFW